MNHPKRSWWRTPLVILGWIIGLIVAYVAYTAFADDKGQLYIIPTAAFAFSFGWTAMATASQTRRNILTFAANWMRALRRSLRRDASSMHGWAPGMTPSTIGTFWVSFRHPSN